jgi:cellulose synthase/poly-beta-1,6-N-acetylglucosamine synthase-like glycosyltransferase
MVLIKIIFWFSLGICFHVYIGYPLIMVVLAKVFSNPVKRGPDLPTVTLLIAAYNEERAIREKIENSLALDYPEDKLEIVVVADGSIDGTVSVVSEYDDRKVTLHYDPKRRGKALAVARTVPLTQGEIIVFSDANNLYRPDVIQKIVANFADKSVGAVTGQKYLSDSGSALGKSENLYWKYESLIRKAESQVHSTPGAIGEIFALRRELFRSPEFPVINEDFFGALQIIRQGYRVIYDPEAISEEQPSSNARVEFIRRSRIGAGSIQALLGLSKWLRGAPLFIYFQVISHRLMRPLVPFFMVLALVTNVWLVSEEPLREGSLFDVIFMLQLLFYGFAIIGACLTPFKIKVKVFYLPYYFCVSNVAYMSSVIQLLSGKQFVLWEKSR